MVIPSLARVAARAADLIQPSAVVRPSPLAIGGTIAADGDRVAQAAANGHRADIPEEDIEHVDLVREALRRLTTTPPSSSRFVRKGSQPSPRKFHG